MTAITLNLLVEEQLAQQQRARDPLKVAIAIASAVVALIVAGGVGVSMLAARAGGTVAALQGRLEAIQSPEFQEQEAAAAALRRSAEEIMSVNQARHLYAPQLALFQDLVPDNIQLSRLQYALAVETIQVAPPDEAEAGKRPARPKVVERLTLRVDGKATSARPELDVDEFIKLLRTHPDFSAAVAQIQLRSIARGPVTTGPAAAGLPTAHFVIECSFQDRT